MELVIQKSVDTPFVNFSVPKKIFEIGGKSLPEDADEFYKPVFDWLKKNSDFISTKSEVHFKMEYFNTASSKRLLDIISYFKDVQDSGKDIVLNWFYSKDDKDMLSAGEEIEEILEIQFNKIQV